MPSDRFDTLRPRVLVFLRVGAALLVGAALVFIWPTRYRYEHLTEGRLQRFVRINRFSGSVQTLAGSEWLPSAEVAYARARDSAYSAGWAAGTGYLISIERQLSLADTSCLRTAVRFASDLERDSVTSQSASGAIRASCARPARYSPDNPFAKGNTSLARPDRSR
jgi:hypothetical protein